jgi:NodT family efflux transporter outer membrane factor (OMF) lipoprotein
MPILTNVPINRPQSKDYLTIYNSFSNLKLWPIAASETWARRFSRHRMRWSKLRLTFVLPVLLTFLCGCTSLREYVHNGFKVGPNYTQPPAPVGGDWIDSNDKRKDPGDISHWWKVFNDPVLDDLVCDAYRQNLTLREAGFRILSARAQLGITVGTIFPQAQFASASYTSTAISGATINGPFQKNKNFGTFSYGFNLAWEIDFWGRYRRAIESADANLDAAVADYDDVLVTMLSDVATNYVNMRTLEKRIEFARKNVEIQTETMKKAEARLKVDANGALTLDQAIALLKQTEAGIPELEIAHRRATNQLCILMGTPPEDLRARLGKAGIPSAPPDVAIGIPADLLRRRPDIRRAERHVAAQCALIGVAESDFYPHISIAGNMGYSAQTFARLFIPQAFNGVVGPTVQWNVLNYGRILNNVRLQSNRFQELKTNFQSTVLNAQQEVENGIITFMKAHERVIFQKQSVEAAQKAEDISKKRWLTNDVTFTTVSLIQQNKVQQDDTLAQVQGEIALGLFQVYKALGGGWELRMTGCEPGHHPQMLPPPAPVQQPPEPAPIRQLNIVLDPPRED